MLSRRLTICMILASSQIFLLSLATAQYAGDFKKREIAPRTSPNLDPKRDYVEGKVSIKCEYNMVNLPPNVIGAQFDYAGVNLKSLLGKPLDLSKTTQALIYLDSTSTRFNQATLNEFQINSVGLTDIIMKWRVSKLEKAFPKSIKYDTLKTAWDGTLHTTLDYSQIFYLSFPEKEKIDALVSELSKIRGVIRAEKIGIPKNAEYYPP